MKSPQPSYIPLNTWSYIAISAFGSKNGDIVKFVPENSACDNEAYPSRKYDGIHALRFNIDSIENGVRKSENYPEQLLYVYGIN